MTHKRIRRIIATAALSTVVTLAVAGPAHAAGPTVLAVNDLPTVLTKATTWLVGIMAGVATLFLTVGGVRHLMAGGDPGEVEKAKGAYKSAAVGYGLAALAPIVVQILNGILFGA